MKTRKPTVDDRHKLQKILTKIYGEEVSEHYTPTLLQLLSEKHIEPREYSSSEKDVILITYGDSLKSDDEVPLQTLHKFAHKHLQEAVNTVHLLPHYPYTSDDGFAVSDYRKVNPELGTWKDVHALSKDFHLMFDGVFNHVSASHPWFLAFLAGDPKYQNYFYVLPPDTDVSAVVRPRASPLLTPFETANGVKYVWTTFSADQIDLNFGNPDVLLEVIDVMLDYVQHGADLIRLDAVGFLWRDPAHNSIHHPKAHNIIRLLREVVNQSAPWVWLVTETNVPHYENIRYFGNGHDQAEMVYNFPLPPLVVHTLQSGDSLALNRWATTLATPSDDTAFFNFTASHDGIGVRGATTIMTDAEVADMFKRVQDRGGILSMRTGADGKETVYEMNVSLFNAVSDPSASLDTQVNQFICSQAIQLSLAGVPGIYIHSLLGSINWTEGVELNKSNRSINRKKLDVQEIENELADPTSRRRKVLDRYLELIKVRTDEPAFSPVADQKIIHLGPEVFAVERTAKEGRSHVLALHNVTNQAIRLDIEGSWSDLFGGEFHHDQIELEPYQVAWLQKTRKLNPSHLKKLVPKGSHHLPHLRIK